MNTDIAKTIYIDPRAQKELDAFDIIIVREFRSYFDMLAKQGYLEYPEAKKLDVNLFEIRVSLEGAYRSFYAYIGKRYVVIAHCFQKKTQKTPLKNLKTAKKRIQEYE